MIQPNEAPSLAGDRRPGLAGRARKGRGAVYSCPRCHRLAWPDQRVCAQCGAALPAPAQGAPPPLLYIRCPGCARPVGVPPDLSDMLSCPACGHMLRLQRMPAGGPGPAPADPPGTHVAPAPPEDKWLTWQRRRRAAAARQRVGLFLGCLVGYSLILVLAPGLAAGLLGWLFLGGAGVSVVLALAGTRQAGRGALLRLGLWLVLGALTLGLLDGALWWLLHGVPAPELLLSGVLFLPN